MELVNLKRKAVCLNEVESSNKKIKLDATSASSKARFFIDNPAFSSDCNFPESRHENEWRDKLTDDDDIEVCRKSDKAILHYSSQCHSKANYLEIQEKNIHGMQQFNTSLNLLEFSQNFFLHPITTKTNTENKITNEEMSSENFKDFLRQTDTLVNGQQVHEKSLIDEDNDRNASILENESSQNKEYFGLTTPKNTAANTLQINDINDKNRRDVHQQIQENSSKQQNKSKDFDGSNQLSDFCFQKLNLCENTEKQQDVLNFDCKNNNESEDFILNEDSDCYGEDLEKILKYTVHALAKFKKVLAEQSAEEKNIFVLDSSEYKSGRTLNSKTHLLSEMNKEDGNNFASVASNSQNSEVIVLEEEDAKQITFEDLCLRKKIESKHYSTFQNKGRLFVNATEFENFTKTQLQILNNQILIPAEQNDLSQRSNINISARRSSEVNPSPNHLQGENKNLNPSQEGTSPVTKGISMTSTEALSIGSTENFMLSEKISRQSLNHIIKDKMLLCNNGKDNTSTASSQTARLRIFKKLNNIFMRLHDDVAQKKPPILEIRCRTDWGNCLFVNNRVMLKPIGEARTTIINYLRKTSRLRFNLIIFLLGRVVTMLAKNCSSTKRELYYQLIKFVKNDSQVSDAVDYTSCLLDEPPWELGITAMSKGLIYGDLKIITSNQTINCNIPGGSLVPRNVHEVIQLISDAHFILIVEKDALFQELLKEDLPNKLTRPFILITGKGYPDVSLRYFMNKLSTAVSVPVFILVDADPYGIDIMLTYRFGSLSMSHLNEYLAVPNAKWIGLHPSEIIEMNISHQPLTKQDEVKIKNILKRPYCDIFTKVKDELEVLLKNNFKAEIEGLPKSDTFLQDFYLPNKLFTQDYI